MLEKLSASIFSREVFHRSLHKRLALVVGISAWAIASFALAQIVVIALLQGLLQIDAISRDQLSSNVASVLIGTASYALMLLILIGIPALLTRRALTLKDVALTRLVEWRDYVIAIAGFVVYILLATVVMQLASYLPWVDIEQAQETGISSPSAPDLALAFMLFVVIAPIVEEVIFRGYLYAKVRKNLSAWATIIIVSVLFGAAHMQWNVGINVFVLSIVMCVGREMTGSIWPGILMHMLKNGLAFYFLFIAKS